MFQIYNSILKWLLAPLIFIGFSAGAQNFEGHVLDAQTKRGIAFATVFVPELSSGILTDSLGFFKFVNFPSSPVGLRISAHGYATSEVVVNASLNSDTTFYLEVAHIHLDEVIVSAPFGRLQHESVTNVESHRLNELNRIPGSTLSETISLIPGVYQSSLGNGIGKPVIRGLSGIRVVTYLHGLRIENQQWGDDHGMGVTEVGLDGVEIIKGPASLLYGSDALGGVLYIVNQPYAKLNRFEGYVQTKFESNTLGNSSEAGLRWNKNGLKMNVFFGHTFHADYLLPNGERLKDSRYSTSVGKLSLGYNKRRWVGNLNYAFSNSYIGIPGHTHDDSLYAELFYTTQIDWFKTLPYQAIQNHFTSLENKFYFDKSQIEFFLGSTVNRLQEFEEKVTIPGLDMMLTNSLYNIRWKRNFGSSIETILGSQGMYMTNTNSSKAEEMLIPDNQLVDVSAYAVIEYALKDLTFQGGARFDNRNIKTEIDFNEFGALNKTYHSYNYSAGLAYQIDSMTFRASISSGFRAPHTSELLSHGVHHGTFRYQIGDPNLSTENATQIDFAMGVHYDHLEITINPFFNQVRNYIYLLPMDSTIEGYQAYQYDQVDRAQLFGGDVSVHSHPHFAHWLHLQSSFSYIYAQDDQQNPLALIPQNRINTQVKIEFEGSRNFRITDFVLQHSFYFSQDRVASYETITNAYHLLHAGINFQLDTKASPIVMSAGVKNMLNETYMDHLSRLKQIAVSMPGMNFYLSIKYNFESKINQKSSEL